MLKNKIEIMCGKYLCINVQIQIQRIITVIKKYDIITSTPGAQDLKNQSTKCQIEKLNYRNAFR